MSRNNPVGHIPIKTPMLSRILHAAMGAYRVMDDNEVKALNEEIQSVTKTNCNHRIYDIAKVMEQEVSDYCKKYLEC